MLISQAQVRRAPSRVKGASSEQNSLRISSDKASNLLKDTYFVIYGIISEFTGKGQFQYLTKLKGPQMGNYLYTAQFLSLR